MTDKPDLGLYIHWPYCARICPYCDFNVYKAANGDPDALLAAMIDDLEHWRAITGPRILKSIHFGGGTPSRMSPIQIAHLLDRASALFGFETNIEIGLEANPMEADAYADFGSAGIERLSVGVQAFNDEDLKRLGRDHGKAQSFKALETAQKWFDRVSIDLIYGREHQSTGDWQNELKSALGLGLHHISAYQLTLEPGTAFAKQAERGTLKPVSEDTMADMFEITQQLTADVGLSAYEISNHARDPSHQSAHNKLYWQGADWIGIGPGAHARVGSHNAGGRKAYTAKLKPVDYIDAVKKHDAHRIETLTEKEEFSERMLMGLRLVETGLDLAQLKSLTGLAPNADTLQVFIQQGLVAEQANILKLTQNGRIFADRIASELI